MVMALSDLFDQRSYKLTDAFPVSVWVVTSTNHQYMVLIDISADQLFAGTCECATQPTRMEHLFGASHIGIKV